MVDLIGGALYTYDPKTSGLAIKARRANGTYTSFQGTLLNVNRKALAQMQEWAAQELRRHIRRDPGGHAGILENAILNPQNSAADRDGFDFLIDEAMARQVVNPERPDDGTYYRAIEFGSTASVGRRLPLSFFGPDDSGIHPNPKRAGKRLGKPDRGLQRGAFVGGLDRHEKNLGGFVIIRKAIRPYRYAGYAIARFELDDKAFYKGLIEQSAKTLKGVTLVVN